MNKSELKADHRGMAWISINNPYKRIAFDFSKIADVQFGCEDQGDLDAFLTERKSN
jgi:hypothetical protein